MPFLAPTLDNADLLFVQATTLGNYLLHVEVTEQDPASGCIIFLILLIFPFLNASSDNKINYKLVSRRQQIK